MSERLEKLGFTFKEGSTHTKRTIMLSELKMVFDQVGPESSAQDYDTAIIDFNCTQKKSGATRRFTASYLKDLYGLDPNLALFRTFRRFSQLTPDNLGTLAFLLAYSRDSLLQALTPSFLETFSHGSGIDKEWLHDGLERLYPDRFSDITKASIGRNLLSTWTQSGHLEGKKGKVRVHPQINGAHVTYALFLAYLQGERGQSMFDSTYLRLLECPPEKAMELAESAARKGWMVFKRVSSVVEVQFPGVLTVEEESWLHE